MSRVRQIDRNLRSVLARRRGAARTVVGTRLNILSASTSEIIPTLEAERF